MQFKDYLSELKELVNQPLSLDVALSPFGMAALAPSSNTLLVGHLLDYLADHCEPHTTIDAIDVAQATWELGVDGSDDFLDQAPRLMIQMARALVA